MIRPITCVCMLLAGASGLYLYQSKHRAQMLDREIGRTIKQTEIARERIGMLKAEWALLNEPERLSELSKNHLGLRTLAPTQFVALADMGARLPAPVAPGTTFLPPGFAPEETALPPPAVVAQAAPPPAKPLPPRMVSAPAAVPAVVHADARPPGPARPGPAPVTLAQIAPPVRPVQVAAAAPPPRAILAPVMSVAATPITARPATGSATAPGTIGEAVLRAMQASGSAPYRSPAVPAYVPASVPASVPAASSLLGGTRAALPPPVPYAAR